MLIWDMQMGSDNLIRNHPRRETKIGIGGSQGGWIAKVAARAEESLRPLPQPIPHQLRQPIPNQYPHWGGPVPLKVNRKNCFTNQYPKSSGPHGAPGKNLVVPRGHLHFCKGFDCLRSTLVQSIRKLKQYQYVLFLYQQIWQALPSLCNSNLVPWSIFCATASFSSA